MCTPSVAYYHLVTGSDHGKLADEVQKAIQEGYQPQGGVAMIDGLPTQAMVKYKTPKA